MASSINPPLDPNKLGKMMARGAASGSSPGSAGNLMPGANAMSSSAKLSSGGGSASLGGIPSRGGAPAMGTGGAFKAIAGSPKPMSMPKPGGFPAPKPGSAMAKGASKVPGATIDSVRSAGRALGHIQGLVNGKHMSPAMGAKMSAPHLSHIDGYNKMRASAPRASKPTMGKFGSLGAGLGGGAWTPPGGGNSMPSLGAGGLQGSGSQIPGAAGAAAGSKPMSPWDPTNPRAG